MVFCPDWVFDIGVARTAQEFLSTEVPIYAAANKYAEGLSEKYSVVDKTAMTEPAERILEFLAEVNAGQDAVEFLNGFVYSRYCFETASKPRKLKPLFGEADEPTKVAAYSAEDSIKRFKAYVFGLRSNSVQKAPAGWRLELEENTLHIADVSRRALSVLDGF